MKIYIPKYINLTKWITNYVDDTFLKDEISCFSQLSQTFSFSDIRKIVRKIMRILEILFTIL